MAYYKTLNKNENFYLPFSVMVEDWKIPFSVS